MAGTSRDRVTIDLRGIGDAVRAAASVRGMGVAQLVRRALVMSLDLRATATVAPVKAGSDGQTPDQGRRCRRCGVTGSRSDQRGQNCVSDCSPC